MHDFHSYIHSLPRSPLTEAVCALYEASEGDARKYMKKVLQSMNLEGTLKDDYGENWSEEVFNKLRNTFVHQGCDVYFIPGIARIAYGELGFDDDTEDTQGIAKLRNLVKFITNAHKGQFTRNLERIEVVQQGPRKGMKVKSNPMTLEQLSDMFSKEQKAVSANARQQVSDELKDSTGNGYTIVELKSFEQAHKYLKYCTADPWCYLETPYAFRSYANRGNRLYLALAPGFENLKPGDQGYGRSMIGFDMSPIDEDGKSELCVCNNRYNHSENLENEPGVGSGDAAYDEVQLSKILGFPVWKKCPGYTKAELMRMGIVNLDTLKELIPSASYLAEITKDSNSSKKFKEQYNIIARESVAGPHNSICFYDGDGDEIGYAMQIEDTDKLLWFIDFDQIAGMYDGFAVAVKPRQIYIVSSYDGKILNDSGINHVYAHDGFPCKVARDVGDEKVYNFLDSHGKFISDEWFPRVTSFSNGKYSLVTNSDKKWNVLYKDGHLMLPKWVDRVQMEYNGAPIFIVYNGQKKTLLDKDMNPILDMPVDSFNRITESAMWIEKDGKFNVVSKGKLCFADWYDGIDSRPYVDKFGGYCYLVTDKSKGMNFIRTLTGLPLLPKWFDSITYIGGGYFRIQDGDKVNIFDVLNGLLVPNMWFDEKGSQRIIFDRDENRFTGLTYQGKPVCIEDGKVKFLDNK